MKYPLGDSPRYEMKCKKCNQLLGYLSAPNNFDDDTTLFSCISLYGNYKEVLCPACEATRLLENKK